MAGITDALPPPRICDNCESQGIKLHRNTRRNRAKYVCLQCKASVYCHKGTDVPLGYMATAKTRYLRAKAHEVFDPLWQHGLMTRDEAYAWLARQMSIPGAHAHIGRLDDNQLERVVRKCARRYRKLTAKAKRQRSVQNATDRRQRTYSQSKKRGGKWKPTP